MGYFFGALSANSVAVHIILLQANDHAPAGASVDYRPCLYYKLKSRPTRYYVDLILVFAVADVPNKKCRPQTRKKKTSCINSKISTLYAATEQNKHATITPVLIWVMHFSCKFSSFSSHVSVVAVITTSFKKLVL